jgi:hypothetical protein
VFTIGCVPAWVTPPALMVVVLVRLKNGWSSLTWTKAVWLLSAATSGFDSTRTVPCSDRALIAACTPPIPIVPLKVDGLRVTDPIWAIELVAVDTPESPMAVFAIRPSDALASDQSMPAFDWSFSSTSSTLTDILAWRPTLWSTRAR